MAMVTRYTNCLLLRDDQLLPDDLWVADGHIIDPKNYFWRCRKVADSTYDCQGKIIVPGFIEVQINGGFGVDFSSDLDNLQGNLALFRKKITQFGITGFCPTMISSPASAYHQALPLLKKERGNVVQGAAVLGAHVEGPFMNVDKRGAHPKKFIQDECLNSEENINEFFGSMSNISIMTIAPELPKACEMIRILVKNNVVCSIGHSNADIDEAEEGVNVGASFITHLFNAMEPFHHRDPGIVGVLSSIKLNRKCFYGIIADGIHTHPAALRIAHRTNPESAVIVTDAMAAMGLGDGSHCIGAQSVTVTGRRAVVSGSDILAGSVATMNSCVHHFRKESGCTLVEAVNCATKHPSQLLKCSDLYGTLDFGTVADFVIIDSDVNVMATFIGGDCVYKSDNLVGFTA